MHTIDKSTLESYKAITSDELSSNMLLKDKASLGGLVLFLNNKDTSTVIDILEIFLSLSYRSNASAILSELLGFFDQLDTLLRTHSSNEVKDLCSLLLNRVFRLNAKRKNSEKKNAQTIVLQLYGIKNENDIELIRSGLIRVRGIISLTFQIEKLRAIIRAVSTVEAQKFITAVEAAGAPETNSEPKFKAKLVRHVSRSILSRSNSRRIERPSISGLQRENPSAPSSPAKRQRCMPNETRGFVQPRPSCVSNLFGSKNNASTGQNGAANSGSSSTNMPAYLEPDADLFEVDEKRGAPQLPAHRLGRGGDNEESRGSISSWLAGLVENVRLW